MITTAVLASVKVRNLKANHSRPGSLHYYPKLY